MPWVYALLRGQKVLARSDSQGEFILDAGRVEIRYKPNDGRRYGARVDNLKRVPGAVLPEETCGPAEAPPAKKQDSGDEPNAEGTDRPRRSPRATASPSVAPVSSGAAIVYADGACSGNPGPAGAGVVILHQGGRVELSEYLGTGTNNIAELTAVLRALEELDPSCPAVIHTDSQYTIGVVQKGWKAKANVELVAKLREALKGRRATRLVYVPGHAGVLLNERADALAREAVTSRRSKRDVVAPPSSAAEPA